tara:strand:+ start:123 stop:1196 length:1074 start_codon:yes stop_codon:yes gene_type:complete
MSDIYGYERGVQYNNDIMSRNSRLQQSIADSNKQTIDDYRLKNQENTAIAKGIESTAKSAESSKAEEKGEEGAGEFLADARNVYKIGGAVRKELGAVNNAVKSYRRANFINEGGGIDPGGDQTGRLASKELDLGSDLTDVADDAVRGGSSIARGADLTGVLRYGGSALQNTLQGSRGVGEAFTGTRSALQATREATQVGDVAGMVAGVGNVISQSKSGLRALDSLGKTAEGLNVVSAGADILDDTDGGFKKMNTAEKVGNIAGITSGVASVGSLAGSLESAGAMLDATGIGAEIGLGLGIAGAVAGGVSAVADYIGGKEKQKQQTPAPTQLSAPTQMKQAQAPISAQQSGGIALSSY